METIFKRFSSIKQFNDYLSAGKTLAGWGLSAALDCSKSAFDFTKTNSYDEANDLLIYGDKKLQRKIENAGVAKTRVEVQKSAVRRTILTSVVGCAPHVPNYIAGTPNAMIFEKRAKVKQRVLNVFYNVAVCGDTSPRKITQAAANFISACLMIEACGVKLNIFTGSVSEDYRQRVGFMVKVKDSGQPFDTLRMSYPLAHPSMNRRHKFRFLEVTEGVRTSWSSGYGCRCTDEEAADFFNKQRIKFDAVLNFESIDGMSAEGIARMITKKK